MKPWLSGRLPESGGDSCLAFFNLGDAAQGVSCSWKGLDLLVGRRAVRDSASIR